MVGVREWDYLFHFYTLYVGVLTLKTLPALKASLLVNTSDSTKTNCTQPLLKSSIPKDAVCPSSSTCHPNKSLAIVREIIKEAPKRTRQ